MTVHALIVVGGIDRSRNRGDGSQGCGVTVARLGEDRAQDFISGFGVGQADTFGQLGQGVAGRSGTQIGIGATEVIEEILIAGREGGAGQAIDASELFHRPPGHANTLSTQEFDHLGKVVVTVFPVLAAPDGTVLSGSHIEGKLNVSAEVRRGLVFVEDVNHLGVPRRSEAGVVVAVAVSLNEKDVVIPVGANLPGQVHVKFAQEGAARKVPIRFVDQVVARNPWFVFVALGKFIPQPDSFAPVLRAFPKGRFGRVVVADPAVATLSARRGVQIEDHVDPSCCAPRDDVIQKVKALLVPHIGGSKVDEVFVVQGETHRIETPGLDLLDVVLRDVVGQPRIVKSLHAVFPHQSGQLLLPRVLVRRLADRVHHVTLHDHPIAKIDRVEDDLLIVRTIDNPGAVDLQQLPASHSGEEGNEERRENDAESHRDR